MSKINNFVLKCFRVLKVTKKPGTEEFINTIKVTGIGIILIGLIGFAIHFVHQVLF